jgi:hypothetical protein
MGYQLSSHVCMHTERPAGACFGARTRDPEEDDAVVLQRADVQPPHLVVRHGAVRQVLVDLPAYVRAKSGSRQGAAAAPLSPEPHPGMVCHTALYLMPPAWTQNSDGLWMAASTSGKRLFTE